MVDVTGLLHNLHQETTTKNNGKPLRIRKGIIKDKTGNMKIVFFSTIIDKVKNVLQYHKIRDPEIYGQSRFEETTAVTQNDKTNIKVTDVELNASPLQKIVKSKVVKIDRKTVIQTYLCLPYNSPVNIGNAVGWCQVCDNVSSQNKWKLRTD